MPWAPSAIWPQPTFPTVFPVTPSPYTLCSTSSVVDKYSQTLGLHATSMAVLCLKNSTSFETQLKYLQLCAAIPANTLPHQGTSFLYISTPSCEQSYYDI